MLSFLGLESILKEPPPNFHFAKVQELHQPNVLKDGVVQGLGIVIAGEDGYDLEFVEHMIDDEIKVVGLLECAVLDPNRDLSVSFQSQRPETGSNIVLINALIKESAKLVVSRISTIHHRLV